MEHEFYKNFSMRKVILSRGRWDTITTHKLIAGATLVVTDKERCRYEYLANDVAEIVEIPDRIVGMAKIRNWILDRFEEEAIFMADDDLEAIHVLTHEQARFIFDPDEVGQIIENLYICAKDAGARVFGFGINRRPRGFHANQPFRFSTWVDQGWGVMGRDLRFDEHQFVKEDLDLCLSSLMKHRIVWADHRYAWVGNKRGNKGGLTQFRTGANDAADLSYLQRKWGPYLSVKRKRAVLGLSVTVERKQRLIPSARLH